MKILEKEFRRYPDFVKGYALMHPPTESEYWEFIYSSLPKKAKYLKHFVIQNFEEKSNYGTYPLDNGLDRPPIQIPKGDLVYLIKIYYEEQG